MKVLVTGSRDWTDETTIRRALLVAEDWLDRHDAPRPIVLIHGDGRGADHLAADWADRMSWLVNAYPANWKDLGKSAGFVRNEQMVNLWPDLVLAFFRPCTQHVYRTSHQHWSHGTTQCAGLAEERGITTWKFYDTKEQS